MDRRPTAGIAPRTLWSITDLENADDPTAPRPRLPSWATGSYQEFRAAILDGESPFPPAARAYRLGTLLFDFADPAHFEDCLRKLRGSMADFVGRVRGSRGGEPILVLLLRPLDGPRGPERGYERVLLILQHIHDDGPHSQPAGIPADPDGPRRSCCFDGLPLRIGIGSPGHLDRRGLNLGQAPALFIQARDASDVTDRGTTERRHPRAATRDPDDRRDEGPFPSQPGMSGGQGSPG